MLPYFAQVRDYDGNVLRVHKACLPAAQGLLRPVRFVDVPLYDGVRAPCPDSDYL